MNYYEFRKTFSVKDFLTQFSRLYQLTNVNQLIAEHPVYLLKNIFYIGIRHYADVCGPSFVYSLKLKIIIKTGI